jgi:hypothetical protein
MKLALPPLVADIARELRAAGHRAVVVGGAVRDALLGLAPKDFDIEVYGIAFDQLAGVVARHGRTSLVGKSFGVVKLHSEEAEYDFTVPRRDSKTGIRHRDFHATFDENITPQEAAARRDFTINAIAWDPASDEILDFFGGCLDLEARRLRATGPAFSEDPLRVLRGLQLAARYDLELDAGTADMCRAIAEHYGTIAPERVSEEFMKWALKGVRPGRIAGYLSATGWDAHFPEIANLAGVPQDPDWHPEGDVGTHTMLVVDAAAASRQGRPPALDFLGTRARRRSHGALVSGTDPRQGFDGGSGSATGGESSGAFKRRPPPDAAGRAAPGAASGAGDDRTTAVADRSGPLGAAAASARSAGRRRADPPDGGRTGGRPRPASSRDPGASRAALFSRRGR